MREDVLQIRPLAAFTDNYIWLLQQGQTAVCVDPGDAAPVLACLRQDGLQLTAIWITHHHHDHIGGVAALQAAFPDCTVFGPAGVAGVTHVVAEGDQWQQWGCDVQVWAVPGHTHNHVAYLLADETACLNVFCGDTLFSAGCGRVFCGTMADLYASLTRFKQLPPTTRFYPAHEYTAANLRFAAHIEPDNAAIQAALTTAKNVPTLPVSLAHERAVNPFLRTDQAPVAQRAQLLSGSLNPLTEAEVFAALRTLKNEF